MSVNSTDSDDFSDDSGNLSSNESEESFNQAENDFDSESENDEEEFLLKDWKQIPLNKKIAASRFSFTGTPGITIPVEDSWKELDFLKLFLDANVISHILTETNRYADQFFKNQSKKKVWIPVTTDEFWIFLGILIYQGVIIKPKQRWYWSKNKVIETPFVKNLMTVNRFEEILKFLHFSNNETYDQQAHPNPKLKKIWEVYEMINANFEKVYIPERDISIDESLMAFKGNISWKQFIPTKRARFGLKFFMMCESKSSYIIKTVLYTGKSTEKKSNDKCSVTTSIVMKLCEKLLHKGYCLTMDNFYNSPELYELLLENKTDAYGTLRSNRKGLPDGLRKTKLKKNEAVCWEKEGMIVMKWCDKKEISLISTCHDATFQETESKFGSKKMKPAIVCDYNQTMGGVDKADQQMATYSIMRSQQKKYYKKLFRHLVDQCLLNAYVLHKKYKNESQEHVSFMIQIVLQIVQTHSADVLSKPKVGRCRIERSLLGDSTPARLTERHFIKTIPPTAGKENPTRKCVICCHKKKNGKKMRKETRYFCKQCDVGLCVDPCFEIYHTKEDF